MGVEFRFRVERRERPAEVLELRVHGVNNTTPAQLLDLPDDAVELVAGDKYGSFWSPREPRSDAPAHRRARVPEGLTREAYSWGGMVRTTPNFGGVGAAGVLAGVVARIAYALLLPFSVGNAALWAGCAPSTDAAVRRRAAASAALGRLFGLVLTLLFTMTAVTLSLDLVGAQCAAQPGLCAPVRGLLEPFATWTAGQRLALFALVPAVGVAGLWLLSTFSRHRYDMLPGMEGGRDVRRRGAAADEALAAPSAALSQPGFWANRITAHLARAHVAGAVALVTALVAQHVAARGADAGFAALAVAAAALLAVTAAVVAVLPTMSPEETAPVWPKAVSIVLLAASVLLFAVVLALLAWALPASALPHAPGERALYGAGFVPLALIACGAVLALTGVAWRPLRGRRRTAWRGCAPAVFMTIALALATSVSAIAIVSVGDLLNGARPVWELIRDHGRAEEALQLPSVWVGLGTTVLAALVAAALVVAVAFAVPRSVAERAAEWGAPVTPADEVVPTTPGVMPLSPRALLARVTAARVLAARLHVVEPAVGVLAALLAAALATGLAWTGAAYLADVSLWRVTPRLANEEALHAVMGGAMWGLGAIGLVLVAVLASGATPSTPRPLGIVWDIACYLPRTAQPFGPPCFAQRAVPEIAGRVFAWLRGGASRRVVLAAHSMGGVLAVSALGLLASSPDTRSVLPRVRLLTFGVQLRAYFGRMFPELLGPDVLGTRPALAPGLFARDPWRADAAAQRTSARDAAGDRLRGTLLGGRSVRWVSLWRLTDVIGFPAASPVPGGGVDRHAEEIDTTGYMVHIGTHGEYFRTPAYDRALRELAGL
ncbi:hypothetical protein [Microbacterium sp. No. 7]|uniref:hypothetical protein n=1 Tax=Microbacterium sp. No. 7 TaxID=1714373 RepID=UPI0006D2208E|nr:hypothetical protein [Microbacterium sp. No. 7]ALJ19175.1 hypothetical protein AOA12_04360 [Microbacterium sp. No. 7]